MSEARSRFVRPARSPTFADRGERVDSRAVVCTLEGSPIGLQARNVYRDHLPYLSCPECRSLLLLDDTAEIVEEGMLACSGCPATYPIVRGVPRFVPAEDYTASFGLQWLRHSRTQYDSENVRELSEDRFFRETGWPRNLRGELVIEVGSGSGRFTDVAARTGAMILSVDRSLAVDANYASNGASPRVLIVQADLLRMPFPDRSADRLYCFGVLQHTPDPRASFFALLRYVKPRGAVVADVYAKTVSRYLLGTKYWVRPVTRHLPPALLYRMITVYVTIMWTVAKLLSRLPKIGWALSWRLLVPNYGALLPNASGSTLREWARLEAFDMLAARYDKPQTLAAVRRWAEEAGLLDAEVAYAGNGVEVRGLVP